jgi:hypothetical protein
MQSRFLAIYCTQNRGWDETLRAWRIAHNPGYGTSRIDRCGPASVDAVERAVRGGQLVDSPLDLGIVDQGRSVVRLDPRIDDE